MTLFWTPFWAILALLAIWPKGGPNRALWNNRHGPNDPFGHPCSEGSKRWSQNDPLRRSLRRLDLPIRRKKMCKKHPVFGGLAKSVVKNGRPFGPTSKNTGHFGHFDPFWTPLGQYGRSGGPDPTVYGGLEGPNGTCDPCVKDMTPSGPRCQKVVKRVILTPFGGSGGVWRGLEGCFFSQTGVPIQDLGCTPGSTLLSPSEPSWQSGQDI